MSKCYWHIHHDILVELLAEPIENRIAFIRTEKAKDEIQLRLRLMRPIRGKLPRAVLKAEAVRDKAWAAWDKMQALWDKTQAAWDNARAEWDKTLADNAPAIEALHRKECPNCPWDGTSIFPSKKAGD